MGKMVNALALTACLLPGAAAVAGYSTCGNIQVPDGTRRCPDGSIPMYHAAPVQPVTPGRPPQQLQQQGPQQRGPVAGDPSSLFGVWHTGVAGGVWQTPSAVPGYDTLHISPGVRAGDLTIDSSGRYVWNSYGGKVGRWERGDAQYPVVLVDTVERKRWKVGPDPRRPGRIFIWDGYVTYNGAR